MINKFPLNRWAWTVLPSILAILLAFGCSSYGPEFDPYAANGGGAAGVSTNSFETVKVERKIPSAWLHPDKEPYRLGPGDELALEVVGLPETQSITFVTPDGRLYYQNVRGLKVGGKTLPDLKATLEKELAKWYQSPQISVTLNQVKSQRIWVLGQVFKPGVYPLAKPTTVVEAISLAGGIATASISDNTTSQIALQKPNPEEVADLSRAFLIRNGQYIPIDFQALLREGQMNNNIYLQNGDYIFLPAGATKEVFVMGEVKNPRSLRYLHDMSLASAIASAGGTVKEAHVQHVVIVRGSLTEPRVAVVPFRDVETGEVRDVALEPHDIVWVPRTPWERVDKLVNDILSTFVRSVAANEGAQFATPQAGRIGTSISVGE